MLLVYLFVAPFLYPLTRPVKAGILAWISYLCSLQHLSIIALFQMQKV